MPNSQAIPATVPVALLYQAGDLGGHLRTALNELGAAIVYESQASDLDRAALEGSGARIVVFNLDPESEAQIDHVYDVLDQGDYEVVFNDADVSAQLSGWDQARWARHLAAKILHRPEIATPPRPAWAESVPAPGSRPVAARPVAEPARPVEAPAAESAPVVATPELTTEPVAPAPAIEPDVPVMAAAAVEPMPVAPAPAEAPTLELPLLEEFLLDETPSSEVTTSRHATPPEHGDNDFASALEEFAAHIPEHQHHAANVDEFASELDALFADTRAGGKSAPRETEESTAQAAAAPDSGQVEFPAIFDQLDAAAVPEAVDGSFKPAPLPARAPAEPKSDLAAAEPLLPPDWSLEPLDETPAAPAPLVKSSAFGIETMSASEFLTPADETAVTPITPAGDAFAFELMPMEEAVAPQAYVEPPAAGNLSLSQDIPEAKFQVGTGAKLRRVIVLGASIGGPEAVREFLGALPAQFPALFVLAQHMGDEFLELMSMQLAKAVRLTVRTPTHGERVGAGDVVIVPTRQRMLIDDEGVIALSPLLERTAYSPSIDQVLRDVADQFGSKAGAIIFSGMAQDAIEGSKYLKSLGGAIWAQDPETCTISTMVESVRQTGTVGFIGSPQQLAEKIVAEFGE